MRLLPDKIKFKKERNEGFIKDWISGMSRNQIAKKYGVSHQCVYSIVRGIPRYIEREEPILTEAEQRIKDNIKNMDVSKFHQRDFSITNLIGALEPLITIQPKHHQRIAI